MNIAVVGMGSVGLVTGACLAKYGNRVVCVDNDKTRIEELGKGRVPFYEPGVDELIAPSLIEKRIAFTTDLKAAVEESLLIFLCVGTPPREDSSPDLSAIFEASAGIARALNGYKIVVIKSTVPVGTAERVREVIARLTTQPFDVAANPEFLREGDAVADFLHPDRVVIGSSQPRVVETLKELYAPVIEAACPVIVMDVRSAEMTKYVANAMLATRVSFMNEMANLSERLGADIELVRQAVGVDKRIGLAYLAPGLGYGGSCLPKDVKALVQMGREHGYPLHLCTAVDQVDRLQKGALVEKMLRHFQGELRGRQIAIWGLAFKPQTDDMRSAASIPVIQRLLQAGASVTAHDPKANGAARQVFGESIRYAEDAYAALRGADALAFITEWNEYRKVDFERVAGLMRSPVIFDGRNAYDPQKMRRLGFIYYGIGRL